MSQSFPAIPSSTSLTDSLQKLIDRYDALRSNFSGNSAPTTGVVGQIWHDADAAAGAARLNICTNETGPVFGEFFDTLMPDLVVTTARINTNAVTTSKILDANVTLAKMANIATDSILGRATASTGVPEVLTALPFAYTGDVTRPADSNVTTIANNAVTLAKMATMATDSILGRATASTGNVEVLTALPFAYTGDVTRPADSNVTTIANDAVTYAKMQNVSATSRVLGRITSGSGDVEELTAANLATILNATTIGSLTFSSLISIEATAANAPRYQWRVTDAPAEQKGTWFYGTASGLNMLFLNDANSLTDVAFSINRSGYTAANFTVGCHIYPDTDNSFSLGTGSFRMSVIYAGTGTINTSDAREKTPFTEITPELKRAIKSIISGVGVFQFLSSVAEKGADEARLHIGVTAQAVQKAFEAEGLDANRWALFCYDELDERYISKETTFKVEAGKMTMVPQEFDVRPMVDEKGSRKYRLGVRYDQLMLLAIAVLFEEIVK